MTKESPSRPPVDKAKRTFHIVASRYNASYVDGLIDHATKELRQLAPDATIFLHRVPGSFEIPVIVGELASQNKVGAIIACGVILQGETNHAQNLSRSVTDALQRIAIERGEGPEKIDEFWEFCPAPARVREFAQPLIEGMVAHLPDIDERIRRYCENYEFRRISAVDRKVLRLAIYEMLYRDDIPPVVSINEAIELAKTFGGGESGRFVNGILDRVKKDLTRPLREAT